MTRCPKCASGVLMARLRVVTGGDYLRDLSVVAQGNPRALIFKDAASSQLQASVCGDCGYTELYAVDPNALVQAVKRAQKRVTQE